jgi:hypothetical protein
MSLGSTRKVSAAEVGEGGSREKKNTERELARRNVVA